MDARNKSFYSEPNDCLKSATESYVVLEKWTEPAQFFQNICVHQRFEAQVERTPDAVAVVLADQQLTYRQLNQQSNQLAHGLQQLGVGPDVLVGIYVERSIEMIVGLLAVLKAGGAYVPLDPSLPAERLSFILADTQVPVILTQARVVDRLPAHTAKVICLDSDRKIITQNSRENLSSAVTPDHLIYTIYTSGSTGQPKGVMIPHSGICNQLDWRQNTFPLTAVDRVLQNISFSFDPSVWQIFWPLTCGAQLILPCPGGHQDVAYLVNLIAEQQISVIALVPSLLRVLLEETGLERCQHLKHVFCGGEALPLDLQERFFDRFNSDQRDVFLHNVYGPTEASIDATFWTCEPGTQHRIGPIGGSITNAQAYIFDENLQPVPFGSSGELHLGGAGLARGYLNRATLTAEKFIAHPYSSDPTVRLYKTGDLVRYLPDGNLEFLGRMDHQVKVRGFRIELGEIETALSQHPAIQESIVVAREDVPGDKRLVAYWVAEVPKCPDAQELRSFLKETLPEYMIPAAFVIMEALPLNPNGKVDRRALPAPAPERPDLEKPFVAPQTPLEVELTQIWEEVLNVRPIGVKDNFFELSGNSLLAAKLLVQVEQKMGQKLSLAVLFQAPTIEQFAMSLQEESQGETYQSLVAIQPKGSKPPLFCVHSRVGNVFSYYPLVRYLRDDQPLYGLQTPMVDGEYVTHTHIEAMAADYIQEIQLLQPTGPYLLAGYSFGGLVAYEMARQLQLQGQTVAMLALLDTYNSPDRWFKRLPHHIRATKHWHEFSKQKGLKEKWMYIQKNFGRQGSPDEQDIDQSASLHAMYEKVNQNYYPQAYAGRAVLFRADRSKLPEAWFQPAIHDADLGWGQLITEGIEIHDIACHHFDLLLDPFVGILTQQLQACIDSALISQSGH